MKKILILLFIALFFSGCLGETTVPDEGVPPVETISTEHPRLGDVVSINYVMRTEGRVIDTTYEDVAKSSPDASLIASAHPFGFEPLTFSLGSAYVNPEFSTALEDMRVGEKKTFTWPPEKTMWGIRSEERVQLVQRFSTAPRKEAIPTPLFQQAFGIEPATGKEIQLDYWNSTITETNPEVTVLTHRPVNNSNFQFPGGNITIVFNEDIITMEFVPKLNSTSITSDGRFVTIVFSNETHMVVDYNPPLAGKTLEVEITLVKVSNQTAWETNLEAALNQSLQTGKPVFLLFTNIPCVSCRRIELETLTHPLALARKDDFIWAKVDTEIQKDVASEYGAQELPLILILKDKRELKRITDFLPPEGMRAEMESALASN